MPTPTQFTFAGPTTVPASGTSANFTLTPVMVITSATITPSDGGAGGSFTPSSLTWTNSMAAQTFVYNAPSSPQTVTITPSGSPGIQPVNLQIMVLASTSVPQLNYQFPQYGPPPFAKTWWNQQLPAITAFMAGTIINTGATSSTLSFASSSPTGGTAPYSYQWAYRLAGIGSYVNFGTNSLVAVLTGLSPNTAYDIQLTYTDNNGLTAVAYDLDITTPGTFATTSAGQFEWGNGTITNLVEGDAYIIYGPTQCMDRVSMKDEVYAAATGQFNLDYQYTPDQGANWYIGKQVSSSTATVDGGTSGYTQEANLYVQLGYQFRIQVYNTGAAPINVIWEKRLVQKRN